MKATRHPIRNTILYGLACGLSFVPLSLILNAFFPWSRAVCLALWLFLCGYALLLNFWRHKFQISTAFPLLLLLPVIFLTDSLTLFFILALIVTGWIRSGICYQEPGIVSLVVELLLSCLGAFLIQAFTPASVFAWALGVWMFFLVQSLYFVFFEHTDKSREVPAAMDAFEQASRKADRILSEILN